METARIVFLDTKTFGEVFHLPDLQKYGEVTVYETTAPEQTLERIKNATIVITNKVVLNQAIITACNSLRLICVAATGTNNVDVAYAQSQGIQVKNIVDYSTQSVAQLTFGLLLHLLNSVAYYDEYVKSGAYAKNDIFTHLAKPYCELSGKRFGILGLGNIGRKVASIAEAFGAEVVYHSLSGVVREEKYKHVSWEELLQTSDVLSIHSPLTDKTKGIINFSAIQQMKPTALLINVGRGGIVQEADLAKALNEELIAGAGLDVFEQEPILSSNPLLSILHPEKIVFSPHIAWASVEARQKALKKVYLNIEQFLQSK